MLKENITKAVTFYIYEQKEIKNLYRGYFKSHGIYPKNKDAAIFFSPSLEYAKTYGDGNVITTTIPDNIFDVFNNQKHFDILKDWLTNQFHRIINLKQDDDGFLPKEITTYIRDAKNYLISDNPKDLMTAFMNVSFAFFNGYNKVGVFEKMFMEQNNIDAMYQIEAGFVSSDIDKYSVAFREMPKYKKTTQT